ncbi:MAG: nucleotidyltransferase domain-containing protein [bacterium]|nr:nucleotidyltransferase domain-containing protein [bacterium]
MIDLKPEYLEEVKRILIEHATNCEVRAFGSRVNGQAIKHSDLDLVLVGKEKLDWQFVEKIKDAFADSNLPFMVDIIDWATAKENFRRIIREEYVVVQNGKQAQNPPW